MRELMQQVQSMVAASLIVILNIESMPRRVKSPGRIEVSMTS